MGHIRDNHVLFPELFFKFEDGKEMEASESDIAETVNDYFFIDLRILQRKVFLTQHNLPTPKNLRKLGAILIPFGVPISYILITNHGRNDRQTDKPLEYRCEDAF